MGDYPRADSALFALTQCRLWAPVPERVPVPPPHRDQLLPPFPAGALCAVCPVALAGEALVLATLSSPALTGRMKRGLFRDRNAGVGMTERSDELSRTAQAEPLPLPRTEQLVNLTSHAVTVESLETAGSAQGSAPVPAMVSYPPDGQVARVRDKLSQQGDAWVHTPGGLLRVTRLRRRPSPVTGLPPAVPGVRYLVSRITAQAARDRADLVFPFGERRDNEGRVTDVSGLGAFEPDRRLADRYRERRRAAAGRRARRPLAAEWRTGLLFALATALLSAWLALFPGNMDNALKNGWGGGGQAWTTWLSVAFLVLGAAFLTQAARQWYWGQKVRAERGTAYVIEEQAIAWRHEDKQWVLDQLAGEFATVLRVPGPEALGERWRWQADERGALEWDRRTDQLVYSFWAVHYNDDQVTRNAVFVWAPWPVAMAFGARVTEFPATAEAIAGWVVSQAAKHRDHVLLLAARMPQEIAVGLGIQLGQRQPDWPQRLYPVHFVGGELVVPDLDLGRHSVPPEQK